MLDEIIELSVKDDEKVSVLLRKRLVLAAKLKNDKLKEWAQCELNGYPNSESLPEYRVLDIEARGHFLGPMGASISNFGLAPSNMPEGFNWWAEKSYFREPIAIFDYILQNNENSIRAAWPQDLVLHVHDAFINQISDAHVVAGDFSSLLAALKAIGVDDADLSLLETAVKEDPAKPDEKSLGVKVTAWQARWLSRLPLGRLKLERMSARR
jgi:hypothetical protein